MILMRKIRYFLILAIFIIGLVGFIQYESGKDIIEESPKTLLINANGNLEMTNGSYSDITKLSIRNGYNGNLIEITNKDEISDLTKHLSRFSYTENSSLEGRRGWSHSIKFYDESQLISTFVISNHYHIEVDGAHYTPDEPGIENYVPDRYPELVY
jgi:hypothetical protein